ncbi:glycoside hydrolase family 53 protein [Psychroserpens mesophilus]|uniref:glycoside hydrolase family 53 protein n=1 Tax=Psychroserpens mesophilus TaxID=325473 RepID=UPI00058E3503|nr:glycosyl hydrolase 53 family protein [Psychroserpens mesophilus]
MKLLTPLLLLFICASCSNSDDFKVQQDNPPEDNSTFYKGMDLSFQSELEDYNLDYKDENGTPVELLDFVSEKGTNLVRLKLWHTPQDGENGLEDVKTYAQRVKAKQMGFLLNIHYSDYWADPGTQNPPVAWQNMTNEDIRIAIYEYTKNVVTQLKNQNTLPDIIQIGNETDSGFLWNYGKVWGDFSNNWSNFTMLVKEAIRAVKEVDTDDSVKIMLHLSNLENAIFFFDELSAFNVDYDIIGLSYYPQFHTKDLNLVQFKLNELATTFDKDVLMVEVAYPFTLDWNDNSTNYIGSENQILSQFSATPQGQKAYFTWLVNTLKNIPNNRGIGFCYWAPDWVAFSGNENTSTSGSSWENQCMFDFNLKALPIFDIYKNN